MIPGGGGASRSGRETALAALFFLVATVVMTWPQAVRLGDAMTDIWDAKLNARIVQWDYHQTLHDPRRLFELNFFHPAQDVLAFSENLWGVSLFGWPMLALGASPLVNYNALLLLGMFLSALSAWALARSVTGDPLASVVAGLVYAFVPWRFSQLPHLQHQWGAFLCLLLLFLLRYLDSGRRRDLVLFGVCFAWNALSNVHYALFSGLLVAVALGLFALEKGRAGLARLLLAAAAAVAGGLTFLPFALAYRRAEELYGMRRYFSEMLFYSGQWSYFLSAGIKNRTWGHLTRVWRGPEGDFFPGLAALALAIVAFAGVRRPRPPETPPAPSPRRLRFARVLDALIAVALLVWIAALLGPDRRFGPLSLGDPGRVIVWLTALVGARLVAAFPARSAYASAGDWLRRSPVPPRAALVVAVAIVGALVALGGNTPYYRFLFQSFGAVFRSIRSPARGIVLFDLALAVLAAWGLAALLGGRSRSARRAWTAAAAAVIALEYRAFPLDLYPVEAAAPPVYRWLAAQRLQGAVVEWPFGALYDCDYVFRQAQHGQPLVNGYSGFFPESYRRLEALLKGRPIPDAVWGRMSELGGTLLVYHPHVREGVGVAAYADALDHAVASGGLELVRSFPHGGEPDFVFAASGSAWAEPAGAEEGERVEARRQFHATVERLRAAGRRLAPPFGHLDAPAEGATVAPGDLGFGWALDDSGIAEVRVETELGAVPGVSAHLPREGADRLFPDYPEASLAGYAFHLPELPAGTHRLRVTYVGRDGGTFSIERRVRVAALPMRARTP